MIHTPFSHLTDSELVDQVYHRNIRDPLVLELAARLERTLIEKARSAVLGCVAKLKRKY